MDTGKLRILTASYRFRAQACTNEYARTYESEIASYLEAVAAWIGERRDWHAPSAGGARRAETPRSPR